MVTFKSCLGNLGTFGSPGWSCSWGADGPSYRGSHLPLSFAFSTPLPPYPYHPGFSFWGQPSTCSHPSSQRQLINSHKQKQEGTSRSEQKAQIRVVEPVRNYKEPQKISLLCAHPSGHSMSCPAERRKIGRRHSQGVSSLPALISLLPAFSED